MESASGSHKQEEGVILHLRCGPRCGNAGKFLHCSDAWVMTLMFPRMAYLPSCSICSAVKPVSSDQSLQIALTDLTVL